MEVTNPAEIILRVLDNAENKIDGPVPNVAEGMQEITNLINEYGKGAIWQIVSTQQRGSYPNTRAMIGYEVAS